MRPAALAYDKPLCASLDGFTLHAATRAGALDAEGREALLRYVLRPPIAQERVELRPDGLVRIALKRAYSDGTVAVDMDPLSLLSRLAAAVPPPCRCGSASSPDRKPLHFSHREGLHTTVRATLSDGTSSRHRRSWPGCPPGLRPLGVFFLRCARAAGPSLEGGFDELFDDRPSSSSSFAILSSATRSSALSLAMISSRLRSSARSSAMISSRASTLTTC